MEKDFIMKKIELEAEDKVINAFKTGELQIPVISNDSKIILPFVNDTKNQIDVLKNIMSEGIEKFEKYTERNITYSEIRDMFG
jgi:hypothetical protein